MSDIFVDIFGEIVEAVRLEYDPVDNKKPYYLYGHYQAIADELMSMDASEEFRDQKYPLVLLGIDSEYQETDISNRQYSVSCNIWIIEETKKEWYTKDRFDNVFKTVLYPIYEILINEIISSKYIISFLNELNPVRELFPYWGSQTVQGSDSKILNDPLDAIKFKLNDLIINKQC